MRGDERTSLARGEDELSKYYDPSALCKKCGVYLEREAERNFRLCTWCVKEQTRGRFTVKPAACRRKGAAHG